MRQARAFPTLPSVPLVVGVSYFLLAASAIAVTRLSGGIALMWLANAPLIAALCTVEPRQRPTVIAIGYFASVAASVLASPVPFAAPFFSFFTVAEAVLAAALMRRWGAADGRLDRVASILLLVLAGGIVAPLMSGLGGAMIARLLFPIDFLSALFDWVLGHGIGTLVAVPLALQLTRRDIDWPSFHARRGVVKASGAAALLIGVVIAVFAQDRLPLLFLPIVPLLIGTFAFQRCGAAVGIILVAVIGGVLTVHGNGPMALIHGGDAQRLQFFQFYLAVLILTVLPVAATLVQRDRLLAALTESETRYRLLADNATDIMLTLDPDGTIRFASSAIRELGHFEPDALIGRNAMTLVYHEDRAAVRDAHRRALAAPDRTFTVEYRAIKANGDVGWFETNTRAVRTGPAGTVTTVISVIRDLGMRKAREAELERAATTDALTGLLNRAAFRARVETARTGLHGPSTLALLDLDHFKRVNDIHGHATGDTALLMLADLLRENLRPDDAIGRVGGEEFAILFGHMDVAGAHRVCERLRTTLAERPVATAAGGVTAITTSIGLSSVDRDQPIESIFREADLALYAAKASGRNRTEIAVSAATY